MLNLSNHRRRSSSVTTLISGVFVSLLALSAHAQDGQQVDPAVESLLKVGSISAPAEYQVDPAVVAKIEPLLTQGGGKVNYFPGPAGMIGVGVTSKNGKQIVVYATPDGSTLFSGIAVDVATSKNIATADMQKLPPPDYSGLIDVVAGRDGIKTNFVTEGDPASENKYYVFFDPRCGFCHRTYNAFLSQLAAGQDLVVHYLPIGILGPESQNIAKEINGMGPEDALDLLRKSVTKQAHVSSPEAIARGATAHDQNLAVFRNLQFDGVPAIISVVGGEYKVRGGAIDEAVLAQELRIAAVDKIASVRQ